MAERVIRTIKEMVASQGLDNQNYWKKAIFVAVSAYRIVPHRATGFSPFMMIYGQESILPQEIDQIHFILAGSYEEALVRHMNFIFEILANFCIFF